MKKKIIVSQNLDELGDPEEFTSDLFPNIDSDETEHLDENGLPKVGTMIIEGTIIVGKHGQSIHFDRSKLPSSLELHTWTRNELNQKYGHLWKVTPLYADSSQTGLVTAAYIEEKDGKVQAVVEIEQK
jgi:DNA-directed RNA polymerase beta subunit